MIFLIRPPIAPTRTWNHTDKALSGCQRNHIHASSTIAARTRRLQSLPIPCSRSLPPLERASAKPDVSGERASIAKLAHERLTHEKRGDVRTDRPQVRQRTDHSFRFIRRRVLLQKRLAARRERSAGLVAAFEAWMRAERARLSRHAAVAKAMDYMLTRWKAFTRFLDDGRICLTNNAAERALRGLALGRKSWLFAGSERGAERAALMYTLIQSAKLNDVDPQAWLADVLARIADTPQTKLDELLPWNWAAGRERRTLAA